jgi:hypothetical protein
VDKIPQKRLFEMERLLYLVQFKVERVGGEKVGEDDKDGGDFPDQDNGENPGLEKEPQGSFEIRKQVADKSDNKGKEGQSTNKFSTPGSSRKVMDWISLFQNREENKMIENSGIAHYSCTQLLRDMEAAADFKSESGRKDEVTGFDDEVMHLLEDLLQATMKIDYAQKLPGTLLCCLR